ncbi:probable ubiquitin carboxyl-terminal hydrolase FAF-X [Myzus persicae]|uniref:probable ubiquitin carboxyl-terminal hydrolase FAF-X n=1 Tax=Myzus persicae TaxID=13164 RepID=UPI000B931191|nr:probable ubiquitin carboxyl-terminal hydrolase FAF-X [Myzus persicae]XP_022160015.1 probable ubiquitin carboxyl-terminal hydrolase FAF-X [Myzus persicae]
MTIATRGQTVGLDSADNQTNVQNVPQQNTQIHSVLSNINILQPQANESHQVPEQTIGETTSADDSVEIDVETKEEETLKEDEMEEEEELVFPIIKLVNLEEKIHSQRWIVPVLPDQELVSLLNVSIAFCKKGLDVNNEGCQKFFRDAMVLSFTRILTDDAVNSWKVNIQQYIMNNCMKLVELLVLKLDDDNFPFLEMLGMLFNPLNKFHLFNCTKHSDYIPEIDTNDFDLYARTPPDSRAPKGWLVDLLNKFGVLGGFQKLSGRFESNKTLTISIISGLIRPFGSCSELLTEPTILKYLMPIVEKIPSLLDVLTDDELKKETKNEGKNDAISSIIKACKQLAMKIPKQDDLIKQLEIFRLKMLLRLLQISSFNGKMNALNEVNKVITNVTYTPHRHIDHDEEYLTPEKMAKWIKENNVLEIVLRDSLHQPQYVEKLEKIIRFVIKEQALSLNDLDALWAAQAGKHDAIVKNVHDLLAKLAWDFSPEQLDHLFECFHANWTNANKKQREKLLELIRRLAEDDKDGVMAHKVLMLFWNLAHGEDVSTEIIDQALSAHVKILDYSCAQDRDAQKTAWLDKCVDELKNNSSWVLPVLKHMRDICMLYDSSPVGAHQTPAHTLYRQEIIARLQNNHTLVSLVTDNLSKYMDDVRKVAQENHNLDPAKYYPDGRYCHLQQVQERLYFLKFCLKDGNLWLCAEQAHQVWISLAEKAVFLADREACFRWFSKLMGEEPDIDPSINTKFFVNNLLQLDPTLLTENGIKCFERFFKAVNVKEGKLLKKRRCYQMENIDLIGVDYLWKVVTNCTEDIAAHAIHLLKEVNTNLAPRLQANPLEFHQTFVAECLERLRAHYDTVSILSKPLMNNDDVIERNVEITKMIRVMKVLYEYLGECDASFNGDRCLLPLHRACRGKHITVIVRLTNANRSLVDDHELVMHSNDNISCVRRQLLKRLRNSGTITAIAGAMNIKLDIFPGSSIDLTTTLDDNKLLGELPFRDKLYLNARLVTANTNLASSPDSSSDSSITNNQPLYDFSLNMDAENCLPTVIISENPKYVNFFLQVSDKGIEIENQQLREAARCILKLIPPAESTIKKIKKFFTHQSEPVEGNLNIDSIYFTSSSSQNLYNLEVLYSMLLPAIDPMADKTLEFQTHFITSSHAPEIIQMLVSNKFILENDQTTKRSIYLVVLKICRLVLCVMGQVITQLCQSSGLVMGTSNDNECVVYKGVDVIDQCDDTLALMKEAFGLVPNPNLEYMLRSVTSKLARKFIDKIATGCDTLEDSIIAINKSLSKFMPNLDMIWTTIQLAWAMAGANQHMLNGQLNNADLHNNLNGRSLEMEDICVCKEALEVLTLCLFLKPNYLSQLMEKKDWQIFLIDLILLANNRQVRCSAAEQFLLIIKFSWSAEPLLSTISLMFSVLNDTVLKFAQNSYEYFHVLTYLLNYASHEKIPVPDFEKLLNNEIKWLKHIREKIKTDGDSGIEEVILEGHLNITKELVQMISIEKRDQIGSNEDAGIMLIKELLEDFIFPASKLMEDMTKHQAIDFVDIEVTPVCKSPNSTNAAFDLIISLCIGCVSNLKLTVEMLTQYFYSEREDPLVEWDYLPMMGARTARGFVGLKNAGATCYMNSVLQQLYMVLPIRLGILSAHGAAIDTNDDFNSDDKNDNETQLDISEDRNKFDQSRKEYNVGILKQVQAIFGHLAFSKVQYYIPRGLWKHFKLQGEPVNLREQQDAVEFFMSLVESLDEALKALSQDQIMSKTLGGSYSDQKICQGCPHRYSKEEPFSVISVDIRNHSNLTDSLEQYVKGELLEGADAYHCDKCNKKVVTVKRLCVKKLPPILAIQLKRFEYDFERVCAIKFNDYFEFPRNLDMEPYTVSGLAKIEGEIIDCDYDESQNENNTKYQLTGIVVHSGQASGGHYYSYIQDRSAEGSSKWYKFDDGDVTECKMDEEEEMKTQCFGGDYMGEVFDHALKRTSYRRQKRWWNAYMLFYTKVDCNKELLVNGMRNLNLSDRRSSNSCIKMPSCIKRSVQQQNIRFLHTRSQYTEEYFKFIRNIATINAPNMVASSNDLQQIQIATDQEELSLLSTQLVSKFIFYVGLHTKKSLRGNAMEWYDLLASHICTYASVRAWFARNILFNHPQRFVEYLLQCMSSEVRSFFIKLIAYLAHYSLQDDAILIPAITSNSLLDTTASLSDHLIIAVLSLLQKEVGEHTNRHLPHYFSFFCMYCNLGMAEKQQLIKLNVAAIFILVAIDEGPGGSNIKYQFNEINKLHSVISILVRCCDCTEKCVSSAPGTPFLPNPFAECQPYLRKVPQQVKDSIFGRICYLKKLIDNSQMNEESMKMLQFVCWENPLSSSMVLTEILWHIMYTYCQELKFYLDLLFVILSIEDSWQVLRIQNAMTGNEDREGVLDTILRHKNQYQRRSYQCIKGLVGLFMRIPMAHKVVLQNTDLKRKWVEAVDWLQEELNRKTLTGSQYNSYNSWTPQSNENTNSFFLERSTSARKVLQKAFEFCPSEDFSIQTLTTQDIEDSSDEGEEVGIQHATDTMTNLVNEPLQVVPDIVPENDDDYDASVPINFNSIDDFDNGESNNVELVNTRIVESSTDMH